MTRSALDDSWPGAQAHAGLVTAPEWLGMRGWEDLCPPSQRKEVPGLGFRLLGDLDRLREATRTGWPFSADDFVAELEAKLGRSLFPQTPGPKPKEKPQEAR